MKNEDKILTELADIKASQEVLAQAFVKLFERKQKVGHELQKEIVARTVRENEGASNKELFALIIAERPDLNTEKKIDSLKTEISKWVRYERMSKRKSKINN